jgi:hypothetical protein
MIEEKLDFPLITQSMTIHKSIMNIMIVKVKTEPEKEQENKAISKVPKGGKTIKDD